MQQQRSKAGSPARPEVTPDPPVLSLERSLSPPFRLLPSPGGASSLPPSLASSTREPPRVEATRTSVAARSDVAAAAAGPGSHETRDDPRYRQLLQERLQQLQAEPPVQRLPDRPEVAAAPEASSPEADASLEPFLE